jgi:hypothetical protein
LDCPPFEHSVQNRPDANEQTLFSINYRRAFSLERPTQSSTQTLSWTRVIPVDPLEAIEVALPSQLAGITSLAKSGDWKAVNLRLANQLKPMETQTSALVNSIDHEVSGEMTQAVRT